MPSRLDLTRVSKKMMYGWILYNLPMRERTNAFSWMIEEGEEFGLAIEVKFIECFKVICGDEIEFFYEEEAIPLPEFVIIRGYDIELAMAFERAGVRVFNSAAAMELSQNKWRSHLFLAGSDVKTPKTIKFRREQLEYDNISRILGKTFVLKCIIGSKGEGVFLVDNDKKLDDVLKANMDDEFICQKFIEESSGSDYRVHVIGGEVVAAIKRTSVNDFRSNFSLGGEAKSVEIDEAMKNLAIRATEALGLEIAGVDILHDKQCGLVCEVNGNAGFITVWKFSDVSIPKEIMRYVKETLERR